MKKAYIGILAEQLMKGVNRMVRQRSWVECRVRVDMTAGTVQPKPMSMGTMLWPVRPSLRKKLSLTKATRAM